MSDPHNTDPQLRDLGSGGRLWSWIAGIAAVVAVIAIIVIADVHHNKNTASNNPSPPATTAPHNVNPPSTTGSGSTSPRPLSPSGSR